MIFTLLLVVLAIVLITLSFRKIFRKDNNIWINQKVHYLEVNKLVSTWERFTQKVALPDFDELVYSAGADRPYFGYKDFGRDVLYLKDLDLIKQVLIKDFDHFEYRQVFELSPEDRIFARMLTNATGKEWKDLRSIMSPTFSTGKIKLMFQHFNTCGNALNKYLEAKAGNRAHVLDFQDTFGRFTLAAIGLIAFGQPVDTFEENSVFMAMGKKFSTFSKFRMMKAFVIMFMPKIAKILKLSVSDKPATDFFTKILQQNIQKRRSEKGSVKRNDFLQLLLEAQAGQVKVDEHEVFGDYEKDAELKHIRNVKDSHTILDDFTILSQALLFFLAGADTLESALTLCAYELALNPEIQEKLAWEINSAISKNQGQLTYEALNEMTYLDAVVSESLRRHPPAFATERTCTKEYILPGTKVRIPRGTRVFIPIRQVHHDSKYYPDPLRFNPENFSLENKAKRHPYAFLPFGQGPRNCIAMRFAMIEAKAGIAHLISKYRLEPCNQTNIPFKAEKNTSALKSAGGCFLSYTAR